MLDIYGFDRYCLEQSLLYLTRCKSMIKNENISTSNLSLASQILLIYMVCTEKDPSEVTG
jgi:hypothetical protein